MNVTQTTKRITIMVALLIVASLTLVMAPLQAQTNPTSTPVTPPAGITFSGSIDSIDGDFIIVNGLLVDLSGADVNLFQIQLGAQVTVFGNLQNGVIQAVSVSFDDDDDDGIPNVTATPTPLPVTPTPTSTPDTSLGPIIVIEGPVTNITATTVQVFDIDIDIDTNDINVTNINIGDNIRAEGNFVFNQTNITIIAINIVIINFDDFDSFRDSRNSNRNSFRPAPPPRNSNNGGRSSRGSRSS